MPQPKYPRIRRRNLVEATMAQIDRALENVPTESREERAQRIIDTFNGYSQANQQASTTGNGGCQGYQWIIGPVGPAGTAAPTRSRGDRNTVTFTVVNYKPEDAEG